MQWKIISNWFHKDLSCRRVSMPWSGMTHWTVHTSLIQHFKAVIPCHNIGPYDIKIVDCIVFCVVSPARSFVYVKSCLLTVWNYDIDFSWFLGFNRYMRLRLINGSPAKPFFSPHEICRQMTSTRWHIFGNKAAISFRSFKHFDASPNVGKITSFW